MTSKKELVAEISNKTGLTQELSGKALEAYTEAVTEFLSKGEKVQLIGFGTFETRERAARSGRNPQTGKKLEIPATVAPVFKAGKALKDAVK